MVLSKWIPISEAVQTVVEIGQSAYVNEYTIETYIHANRLILSALADYSSGLFAKPKDPELFQLRFRSDEEERSIPLQDDGTIPNLFWLHLKEVWDQTPQLLAIDSPDRAHFGDPTYFRASGLRDNGVLEGKAGIVLVERAKLPGNLPRRRGERGPSKDREHNKAIAEEAARLVNAGEPQRAVVARLYTRMEGNSDNAKKAALRELLKGLLKNAD